MLVLIGRGGTQWQRHQRAHQNQVAVTVGRVSGSLRSHCGTPLALRGLPGTGTTVTALSERHGRTLESPLPVAPETIVAICASVKEEETAGV